MSDEILLKDTCDWLNGGGILTKLQTLNVPWKTTITTPQNLDDDYYANHSGNKPVSNLTSKLLDDDNELTASATARLAQTIFIKYNDNWTRAWAALQEAYDPLHNYDGTETTTSVIAQRGKTFTKGSQTNTEKYDEYSDIKGEQTNSETLGEHDFTKSSQTDTEDIGTRTDTKGQMTTTNSIGAHTDEIDTAAQKETTEDGIQGFNSSAYQDANKSTTNRQAHTDKNKYGAQTNTESETARNDVVGAQHNSTTEGQRTDTFGEQQNSTTEGERTDTYGEKNNTFVDGQRVDSETENGYTDTVTVQKGGNLGVTTSQQMLTSELEFRKMYNFFDTLVFPNIDQVLCQKYYVDINRGLY